VSKLTREEKIKIYKKKKVMCFKIKTGFEPSQQDVNILNGEFVH